MSKVRELLDAQTGIDNEDEFEHSDVSVVIDGISSRISDYEETAEEILTAAINVEHSNELLDAEVEALKKLIDNLRSYDKKLNDVRKHVKEVSKYLWQ